MNEIRAYYKIDDRIATSGQPTEAQFSLIAKAGYEVVINLALSSSTYAIENEDEIVESLGMKYVHIPVDWDMPTIEDVVKFFDVMALFASQKVWVHCALNMRVSCFLYLYQRYVLGKSEIDSRYPMSEIWEPSDEWLNLIESASRL